MTEEDLRNYDAPRREPTRMSYRGLDIWGMGPPSSGGSTVGETLNILEGYADLGVRPDAGAASLPRGLALRVRRSQRLRRRPGLLRRAARRPALGRLRGRAPGADQPRQGRDEPGRARQPLRRPGRPRPRRGGRLASAPVDDPSRGVGPPRHGRLLHVHDRVDGRQRHRRAGLRLPAEQRADRLQLRRSGTPEPRRGRQAPAQLDEPDDRHAARRAAASRSARPAARRSSRPSPRSCSSGSTSAPRCRRRSPGRAPRSATRRRRPPSPPSSARPRARRSRIRAATATATRR